MGFCEWVHSFMLHGWNFNRSGCDFFFIYCVLIRQIICANALTTGLFWICSSTETDIMVGGLQFVCTKY